MARFQTGKATENVLAFAEVKATTEDGLRGQLGWHKAGITQPKQP